MRIGELEERAEREAQDSVGFGEVGGEERADGDRREWLERGE